MTNLTRKAIIIKNIILSILSIGPNKIGNKITGYNVGDYIAPTLLSYFSSSQKLVFSKYISCIYLLLDIIQTSIVAVGDDSVALRLEY